VLIVVLHHFHPIVFDLTVFDFIPTP